MSLKSASDRPFQVICKITLFAQLGELPVRVCFDVVVNLALLLLVETTFIDRFVEGSFPMKRFKDSIWSRAVRTISEYNPPSDLQVVLHTNLDT